MMAEKVRNYCSQLSWEASEPLIGSIAPAQTLLLLEYNEEWGFKAFEESHLPTEVKDYLNVAQANLPSPKLLLIKSHRRGRDTLFLLANLRPEGSSVYAFHLNKYADLLELPLQQIATDHAAYQSHRTQQPFLFVCTNGRRDICCSKFGFHVYEELARLSPSLEIPSVWEMSHVGGHRFAPNVLCLPQGALYGRVGVEQAQTLWARCQADALLLSHLRGRLCFPPAVQAADYYLRQFTGETKTFAYRLLQSEEIAPRQWLVHWEAPDSKRYLVTLQIEKFQNMVYESCAFDKPVQPDTYHLISIQTEG